MTSSTNSNRLTLLVWLQKIGRFNTSMYAPTPGWSTDSTIKHTEYTREIQFLSFTFQKPQSTPTNRLALIDSMIESHSPINRQKRFVYKSKAFSSILNFKKFKKENRKKNMRLVMWEKTFSKPHSLQFQTLIVFQARILFYFLFSFFDYLN